MKQKSIAPYQRLVLCGLFLILLSSCAYYNTFYNAKKYYKEGRARYQTNPSQAKTSFDKAIEKSALVISNYPRSKYVPDALFIIGMSSYYTGEYTKAISKFENLLLVFPSYPRVNEANLYLAVALIEIQEYNQAVERLQILDSRTTSREIQELAMFKMAELYFFRKDYPEAIPVLENFLAKYPKSEKYYQALLMLGDAERAVKDLTAAITTYELCLNKTRQQIGNAATDTSQLYKQVNLHLAECFIEANRQNEGLQIIDEIVSQDTLANTKSKLSVKVFLDLGNLFLRMNEPERARHYLRKVTSVPEQIEAYYRLANSYESEAKFDTAKAYYDSVVLRQATSEFSALAQSRLELLKLVVSDASPIPPMTFPKDTNNTKSEDIKQPKEIEKLEDIEKSEDMETLEDIKKLEEIEQSQEIQLPESLDMDNFNFPDSLPFDTLDMPIDTMTIPIQTDTMDEIKEPLEIPIKTDTLPEVKDTLEIPVKTDTLLTIKKDTIPKIDSAVVQFHLAEIYNLNLKKYERAITEYEKVYEKYPQSAYAPKALFAQAWLYKNILGAAQDTNEFNLKYKQVLDKIIVNYPSTEYATQARQMLADLIKKE